jgi:murein DD-endopeptidase MepM/ murein hydrolase activator NlpD
VVGFANPVPGHIYGPMERWPGRPTFHVAATFAQHIASKRPPGVDISNQREGDPVLACDNGVIAHVLRDPNGALIVRLRVDSMVGTLLGYAHLHSYTVSEGQRVKRGQVIGRVGSTGAPGQPHLHLGMNVNGRERDVWPYLQQNQEVASMGYEVFADSLPAGTTWRAKKNATYTVYKPDGSSKKVDLDTGSSAPASHRALIKQTPPKAPNGAGFILISAGSLAGWYAFPGDGDVVVPPTVPLYTQAQLDAAVDKAEHVAGMQAATKTAAAAVNEAKKFG